MVEPVPERFVQPEADILEAGTEKSTVLRAIARAHQADGRQIIVTSTGAIAAERLAAELTDAGGRT